MDNHNLRIPSCHNSIKQAEAEVVPSSSLVEVEVVVEVGDDGS